jgi:Pentapeptide repeats (8 copies)
VGCSEADEEHVAQLRKGAVSWNAWREENPEIYLDLYGADLRGENLSGANLSGANLSGANLHGRTSARRTSARRTTRRGNLADRVIVAYSICRPLGRNHLYSPP